MQWANDLSFAPRMQRQLPGGFRTLMPAIVILYETVGHAIRGCFCALHRSSRYHAGTDELSAPLRSVGGPAGEDEDGWLVSTPCESAECSDTFFTARVLRAPGRPSLGAASSMSIRNAALTSARLQLLMCRRTRLDTASRRAWVRVALTYAFPRAKS